MNEVSLKLLSPGFEALLAELATLITEKPTAPLAGGRELDSRLGSSGLLGRACVLSSCAPVPLREMGWLKGSETSTGTHATHAYSWINPPSMSRRPIELVRTFRLAALGVGTGVAKPRPRCGRSRL